jgi:hypothetical protein
VTLSGSGGSSVDDQEANRMKKLTLRQKAAVAAVGVVAASTGGVAWAYLTTYGNGTAQATVAASPPFVNGNTDTGMLVPGVPGAVGISVHNPLTVPVEILQIPVGHSESAVSCPEYSVTVGGQAFDGTIVPNGDGVNPLVRTDTGSTVIAPGESGTYYEWGLFDTASFPVGNEDNNQDGCLGQTLSLSFGPVTFQTVAP